MERTINGLRKGHKGKLYIWLKDNKTIKEFLADAEAEGYRFGKIKPTESNGSSIIAVEGHKQLSYLGFVGHMAFETNQVTRIDYAEYKEGSKYYYYNLPGDNNIEKIDINTRFHGKISVMGDDRAKGAAALIKAIPLCKNEEDEYSTIEKAEEIGKIWVIYNE